MNEKIIIIGGVGNGSVIAAAIRNAAEEFGRKIEFCGYLNDRMPQDLMIEGYPILGKLADFDEFLQKGYKFIYSIYKIGGQVERIKLFENLNIPDEALATFVHPSAYIAGKVKLSSGVVVMPNTSISPGVEIGKVTLVMPGTTIGHNTVIGDHCHLAAQSCLGSFVKLGIGIHVGLNASIREDVKIGDYSALGMGSVLLEDISEKQLWVGNPARLLRSLDE